tara:strand:- start:171 stop:338 length:168 start_codon:yes stop_codon:yes gene_type:complete
MSEKTKIIDELIEIKDKYIKVLEDTIESKNEYIRLLENRIKELENKLKKEKENGI